MKRTCMRDNIDLFVTVWLVVVVLVLAIGSWALDRVR